MIKPDASTQPNLTEAEATTWSVEDSAKLYGVRDWGAGYFDLNDKGEVVVKAPIAGQSERVHVAIPEVIEGMRERGLEMPAILRIENLLDDRIKSLNEAFARAIARTKYQNHYRGVFPIKVNQQAHVIDEIASFGRDYHHGLEAGSKAELIIALAKLEDNDSVIVCNGYKDSEFIELGLNARKLGIKVFFVVETPTEVPVIIERARALKVDPLIGVRIRTSTKVDGHWAGDSGDQSIFGVSSGGLMKVIDTLKDADMLHCLQLLHCHIGSQIPNIRNIRMGVMEACRYYTGLLEAGAPMGYLDLGGGLAVDYEGTRTNSTHSMNYQLDEYCVNVVETVIDSLRSSGAAHPVLITESGRATVSYASVLLFNILDVRDHRPSPLPDNLQDTLSFKADSDAPDALKNLWWVAQNLSLDNFQESYNDAIYYRDALREDFLRGQVGLPIRALADNIALEVFDKVAAICAKVERVPEELKHLPELLSDTYYGNFSLFQSLPDMWAIDQILPVMPVHRLTEAPTRNAVIADITCDCDGKIDHFSINGSIQKTLPMHEFDHESDYHLGVFLVGAYQETLGDLHNLFGDTNVVSISVKADGTFEFAKEMHGDSISDVLSYVEYDPKALAEQFRRRAEKAVKNGTISAIERREIMSAFYESLDGYTYYEQD